MGIGKGFGKIILFGEHFVVHGAPAVAAGISNSALVEVKSSNENHIVTKLVVIPEYSKKGITLVLKSMGIKETYAAHLTGDLPTYGGLGSSAAFCVGLVRALADEKHLKLTDEEVNHHAHEGEKAFHGNPSGVDDVTATYGGLIQFTRGKTHFESKFERLKLTKSLDFVVSSTGKYGPTAEMVEKVRRFHDSNTKEFESIMNAYSTIFATAKIELTNPEMSLELLGSLMNDNHELLKKIGIVDPLNQKIVDVARQNGALGAKVTGGGGGGCCIVLCKDKEHAELLAKIITKNGFDSFCTRVVA